MKILGVYLFTLGLVTGIYETSNIVTHLILRLVTYLICYSIYLNVLWYFE